MYIVLQNCPIRTLHLFDTVIGLILSTRSKLVLKAFMTVTPGHIYNVWSTSFVILQSLNTFSQVNFQAWLHKMHYNKKNYDFFFLVLPQAYVALAYFGCLFRPFDFTAPKVFNYLSFPTLDFIIWWKLFQKCVVHNKCVIYVFIEKQMSPETSLLS